ncbi:DUF433 domain-containing protein [Brachyspira aalborgi]|uniref:Uncharacterized protein n=1 Tax=Brachyspira aalborgi TaxID=29522 RepID=A0A5C8EN72_9SPIR|nr:DUF433 domain-containing protein [Brachyspira aalborgi]TXJ39226.1 hypothetical protein EPJ78_00865 [Brachyspira aalborgi]
MADNKKINNNQIKKNNLKSEENEFGKLSPELEKLEAEWTVEDTMAMYPSLTREEAERAWEMGW